MTSSAVFLFLFDQVIDTDPVSAGKAGQYNDVSQVEKFEISTEQYANRRGNHHSLPMIHSHNPPSQKRSVKCVPIHSAFPSRQCS